VLRQLIRSIADPVQLGKTGETHFVLGDHWRSHFLREQAKEGAAFTVANLRKWMDQPLAMGLPAEAQNLIILTFAGQTNRQVREGQCSLRPRASTRCLMSWNFESRRCLSRRIGTQLASERLRSSA
jgi:hypothetical protein